MRILWVKVGGLWPPTTGGRIRSLHILGELSRHHTVTLLTTHGPGDELEGLRQRLADVEVWSVPHASAKRGSGAFAGALVRSWLSSLPVDLWRWKVPALRREVERRIAEGSVDLCLVDFLVSAPNVPRRPPVPVVLFEHNVEHLIWKRLCSVEARPGHRVALEVEWRKMRRYEARACVAADLTLAVSEADGDVLRTLAPGARIRAIPTGVDTAYFSRNGRREAPAGLVFCGSMDWYPNEDAMLHFLEEVLPLVRRDVPDASLTIVGRNPSPRLSRAAAEAGARVTGTVEDVRPYVGEGAVFIVPLRVGGGTRLKIFEALAMGKAVVSTRVGAEGLPLVPGRHFLRADDPAAFAAAVTALLHDPARRQALGTEGRRLVEARYSWAQVAQAFEKSCIEGLADGGVVRALVPAQERVSP